MASKWPPVRGAGFDFPVVLFAQSGNQIKTTPTIAAGDFQISKDYGAFANLATLPDEDPNGSGQVKVVLSADEMTADVVMVRWIDAAGAEWHSGSAVLMTVGQTFDAMDANIDSVLADTNELQGDWVNGGRLDLILDATALETTAQSILTDTAEIGAAGAGLTTLATQASVNDLPTNAELATALGTADDAVLAAIATLNNLSSAGAQSAAAAALAAYDAATGADVAGLSTFDPDTDDVTVGGIDAGAIDAAAIAAAAAEKVADAILARSYEHVEDAAGDHTLAALIAGALESVIVGTTWTIYKTDGVTAMVTKTVTTDDAAEPITGVA